MIALSDLAWWVHYILSHRSQTSGRELRVASDWVDWDYLVSTFQSVTGAKAHFRKLSLEEWFDCLEGHDRPVANEKELGDGSTTIRESFSGFWCLWREDVIKRDFDWIRRVHPKTLTLADWMKQTSYNGDLKPEKNPLKNAEDGKGRIIPNHLATSSL